MKLSDDKLEHFPISFFAVVMGLSGLALVWEKMQHVLGLNLLLSWPLLLLVLAAFGLIAVNYGRKLRRFPQAVRQEMMHPIKLNFFPAISISLLLISVLFLSLSKPLATLFWMFGTGLHFALTLTVVNMWVNQQHYEVTHMNPAWFIPAVGNVIVPVTGATLGYQEVSWFFFSIGMLFWGILLTIMFYRLMFHHPIPGKLLPTLVILIAPPAVGFIAYLRLNQGELDGFARFLFYAGLFMTLFLATQIDRLRKLPFFLSWWAYSFPLAAITLASWTMYEKTGVMLFALLAALLQLVVTAVVIMLLQKTWSAIRAGTICIPE